MEENQSKGKKTVDNKGTNESSNAKNSNEERFRYYSMVKKHKVNRFGELAHVLYPNGIHKLDEVHVKKTAEMIENLIHPTVFNAPDAQEMHSLVVDLKTRLIRKARHQLEDRKKKEIQAKYNATIFTPDRKKINIRQVDRPHTTNRIIDRKSKTEGMKKEMTAKKKVLISNTKSKPTITSKHLKISDNGKTKSTETTMPSGALAVGTRVKGRPYNSAVTFDITNSEPSHTGTELPELKNISSASQTNVQTKRTQIGSTRCSVQLQRLPSASSNAKKMKRSKGTSNNETVNIPASLSLCGKDIESAVPVVEQVSRQTLVSEAMDYHVVSNDVELPPSISQTMNTIHHDQHPVDVQPNECNAILYDRIKLLEDLLLKEQETVSNLRREVAQLRQKLERRSSESERAVNNLDASITQVGEPAELIASSVVVVVDPVDLNREDMTPIDPTSAPQVDQVKCPKGSTVTSVYDDSPKHFLNISHEIENLDSVIVGNIHEEKQNEDDGSSQDESARPGDFADTDSTGHQVDDTPRAEPVSNAIVCVTEFEAPNRNRCRKTTPKKRTRIGTELVNQEFEFGGMNVHKRKMEIEIPQKQPRLPTTRSLCGIRKTLCQYCKKMHDKFGRQNCRIARERPDDLKCTICSTSFATTSNKYRHIKKIHPN